MTSPPERQLGADRTTAAVRGLGWLLLAALIGGGCQLAVEQASWSILWRHERASFLALGFLVGLLMLAALYLTFVGFRWLAFAGWPGHLGVRVTAEAVEMNFGPFGTGRHDWKHIRVEVDPSMDPELIAQMPDDALTLRLRHPDSPHDLAERVQRFCRMDTEELTTVLRPYLRFSDQPSAFSAEPN